MSEVEAFFRHCPNCGKRFHIRLVSRKLVGSRTEEEPGVCSGLIGVAPVGQVGPTPTLVSEGAPVVVDVQDFQYAYRCGHCGHTWYELRTEQNRTV